MKKRIILYPGDTFKVEEPMIFKSWSFTQSGVLGVEIVLETPEPLEAKPLWGHMPNFRGDIVNGLHWIAWGSKTNETWFIETPAFKSEAATITAWNQLVDRIEGER